MNTLSFAQDESGAWGYKIGGADTVNPFKSGLPEGAMFVQYGQKSGPSGGGYGDRTWTVDYPKEFKTVPTVNFIGTAPNSFSTTTTTLTLVYLHTHGNQSYTYTFNWVATNTDGFVE